MKKQDYTTEKVLALLEVIIRQIFSNRLTEIISLDNKEKEAVFWIIEPHIKGSYRVSIAYRIIWDEQLNFQILEWNKKKVEIKTSKWYGIQTILTENHLDTEKLKSWPYKN